IDGDKAIVNNDGDNAISNGGTGTQINGDEATVNNNGNTTVDGKDATGTEIAGNNAVVNQDGRWMSAAVLTGLISLETAPLQTRQERSL
ncbi:hypothetical protein, partial [Escherichia coli]|uniref:hypothetical protein n=1 Tax=Escherichia coli TaxID=562 RepID=UPI003F510B60